jgi:hypothetical protein
MLGWELATEHHRGSCSQRPVTFDFGFELSWQEIPELVDKAKALTRFDNEAKF